MAMNALEEENGHSYTLCRKSLPGSQRLHQRCPVHYPGLWAVAASWVLGFAQGDHCRAGAECSCVSQAASCYQGWVPALDQLPT